MLLRHVSVNLFILCDLRFAPMKEKDLKKKSKTLKACDKLSPRQEKENKYIKTVHLACTFHSLVGCKQTKHQTHTAKILVDQNTMDVKSGADENQRENVREQKATGGHRLDYI